MEDFKTLPGYSRYGITQDGRVFNHQSQSWLQGSVNPDGYVNFRLTDDQGNTKTFGRHSLIAQLFVSTPDFSRPIVNHRNGIKGDDRTDNLEWTTYQGNLEHAGAMGLTEKCHPTSTRNALTGEITHYPSAIATARSLGFTKDAILYRLHGGEERVYPEGLQYRYRNDSIPWSTEARYEYGRSQSVLVRDIETGNVSRFDKQADAAIFLGISDAGLSNLVRDSSQPLVSGRFLIKLETDFTVWRTISDQTRETALARGTKAVIAIEAASGKEVVYMSAKECADIMGIGPTTLNERLKSNGNKTFKDGYRYRYY